jgi:transposase-like protein
LEGYKGYKTITRELDLLDTKTIRNWVKAYRELGEEGLQDRRGKHGHHHRSSTNTQPVEQELLGLRAENAYLKKLLELKRRDAVNRLNSEPSSN